MTRKYSYTFVGILWLLLIAGINFSAIWQIGKIANPQIGSMLILNIISALIVMSHKLATCNLTWE